jgi:Domain of unknown function (DUF222)
MERWVDIEKEVAEVCGILNVAHARLVDLVVEVLENDLWSGHGVNSPEFWVAWQTGMSPSRGKTIVDIARRRVDLPATLAAFSAGELSVDQVGAIAKYTPSHNDHEMCDLARCASVTQLRKAGREYAWEEPYVQPKPSLDAEPGPRPTVEPDDLIDDDDDSDDAVWCETRWSPDCWCQDECSCDPQPDDRSDVASNGAGSDEPGETTDEQSDASSHDGLSDLQHAAGGDMGESPGGRGGRDETRADTASSTDQSARPAESSAAPFAGPPPRPSEMEDEVSFWFDDNGRFHMDLNLSTDLGALTEASLKDVRRALFNAGDRDVTWAKAFMELIGLSATSA